MQFRNYGLIFDRLLSSVIRKSPRVAWLGTRFFAIDRDQN